MIDMNKLYKYRNAPEGQELRRILCVDRKDKFFPIVSEAEDGTIFHHDKDGEISGIFRDPQRFSLKEVSKYDHIKKGDIVMVWNDVPRDARLRVFDIAGDKHVAVEGSELAYKNCELIQDYADKYLR